MNTNTDKATTETLERRPVVTCRRCGRQLTHPDSYAAGIGPECSERWGVCQQELARLHMDMDPNLVAAAHDDGPSVISLNNKGDRLILRFRFDENGSIRRKIKAVPGWMFNFKDTRLWSVPATKPNLDLMMELLPQARIYIKDLERTRSLPQTLAPRVAPAIQPRKAWVEDGQIRLFWDYNDRDFQVILAEVKECPGRRWNGDKKYWTAPPSLQLIALLESRRFAVAHDLREQLAKLTPKEVKEFNLPEGLNLFPFQVEGVKFVESRHGRALIADSMGLGKTIQALTWLRLRPEARPAVIVVPASLKINWAREGSKWLDKNEQIQIVSGRPKKGNQKLWGSIIIINYDILKDWVKTIKQINPQTVVFDECHLLKNNKAQRTIAGKDLAKDLPHVIAMSGTPIINRPIEFYNAISLVNPAVFPSWYKFASRFCAPKFNGFGVEYTGASNTEELHHVLTNPKTGIMIRRLKRDVLKDLPAKIRSVIPLELENRAEYERAAEDFLTWLYEQERDKAKERLAEEGSVAPENIDRVAGRIGQTAMERASAAETLVAIGKLKQLAARGKLNSAIGWIKDVVEQGEKIIVFAVHHWVVGRLMEAFGTQAVRLTGKENQEQRQAAVDAFQADESIQVFVGNIKAAGVGITLTAATHVAFVEMGWTPGEHMQAEDRAHRIGQEQVVNVYYLVAEGTIEEDIAEMLDRKADVLGQVLDGKKANEESILGELLKKMKEKRDGKG